MNEYSEHKEMPSPSRAGEIEKIQEGEEKEEITISEAPFTLEEMEKLAEGNEGLEKWVRNTIDACLTYDSDIGRVAALKKKKERTEKEGDQLNELMVLARLSLKTLEDSLNILSRHCLEGGVSNEWRRKFFSPVDIADWAIRAAANLKRQASKEIHNESI